MGAAMTSNHHTPTGFDLAKFTGRAAVTDITDGSIDHLADEFGISADTCTAIFDENIDEIAKLAALMRADGRDIQIKAQKVLGDVVEGLGERVADGTLTTVALLRAAEVMHKVSGLEAKQKRANEEQPGRFVFNILFSSDAKPMTFDSGPIIEAEVVGAKVDPLAQVREVLNRDG
jgi:hypothetical protein